MRVRYIPKMKKTKTRNGVHYYYTRLVVSMIHLTGTLIQPLAKAMAKITKGVDIPKMIM